MEFDNCEHQDYIEVGDVVVEDKLEYYKKSYTTSMLKQCKLCKKVFL